VIERDHIATTFDEVYGSRLEIRDSWLLLTSLYDRVQGHRRMPSAVLAISLQLACAHEITQLDVAQSYSARRREVLNLVASTCHYRMGRKANDRYARAALDRLSASGIVRVEYVGDRVVLKFPEIDAYLEALQDHLHRNNWIESHVRRWLYMAHHYTERRPLAEVVARRPRADARHWATFCAQSLYSRLRGVWGGATQSDGERNRRVREAFDPEGDLPSAQECYRALDRATDATRGGRPADCKRQRYYISNETAAAAFGISLSTACAWNRAIRKNRIPVRLIRRSLEIVNGPVSGRQLAQIRLNCERKGLRQPRAQRVPGGYLVTYDLPCGAAYRKGYAGPDYGPVPEALWRKYMWPFDLLVDRPRGCRAFTAVRSWTRPQGDGHDISIRNYLEWEQLREDVQTMVEGIKGIRVPRAFRVRAGRTKHPYRVRSRTGGRTTAALVGLKREGPDGLVDCTPSYGTHCQRLAARRKRAEQERLALATAERERQRAERERADQKAEREQADFDREAEILGYQNWAPEEGLFDSLENWDEVTPEPELKPEPEAEWNDFSEEEEYARLLKRRERRLQQSQAVQRSEQGEQNSIEQIPPLIDLYTDRDPSKGIPIRTVLEDSRSGSVVRGQTRRGPKAPATGQRTHRGPMGPAQWVSYPVAQSSPESSDVDPKLLNRPSALLPASTRGRLQDDHDRGRVSP
jgi:hypothetical protein